MLKSFFLLLAIVLTSFPSATKANDPALLFSPDEGIGIPIVDFVKPSTTFQLKICFSNDDRPPDTNADNLACQGETLSHNEWKKQGDAWPKFPIATSDHNGRITTVLGAKHTSITSYVYILIRE